MMNNLWISRVIEIYLVICLIAIGLFFLLYRLPMVSATYDEGYSYLGNGEYLVRNFNWETRPYILLHPPLSYYIHGWTSLVFKAKNIDERLLTARISMLPLYIIFSGLIYLISKRWFGRKGAFIGLILYLFNPEILAHARFITPDHLLALTMFLSLITFYKFVKDPTSFPKVLSAGVSLGLAFLSKYTGLLMVPLLAWLSLISINYFKTSLKNTILGFIVIMMIAIMTTHIGYLFQETGKHPHPFISETMKKITSFPFTESILTTIFPRAYLNGSDFQIYESNKGVWWGYFYGNYYPSGLWYFYPIVFLIKTPLPLLILILLALLLIIYKKISFPPFILTIIVSTVVYFFLYFIFFNKLIIGLRYLIMVYPLLFVFVSATATVKFSGLVKKIIYVMILIMIIWYTAGSIKIAPFYLAYANELIGGPKNLWKYVADSNLDWNQDQKFFAQYKTKHPEIIINPREPLVGKLAFNVNEMSLYHFYEYQWLRNLNKDPIDHVGYTWLIFDITWIDLNNLEK